MTTSSAPAWLTALGALASGTPAQIYVDLDWLLKAGLWTPLVCYTAEEIAAEWGVPRQVADLPLRQLAREGRIRQSPPGYVAAGPRTAAAPAQGTRRQARGPATPPSAARAGMTGHEPQQAPASQPSLHEAIQQTRESLEHTPPP